MTKEPATIQLVLRCYFGQIRDCGYLRRLFMNKRHLCSSLLSVFFIAVFTFSAHGSTFDINLKFKGPFSESMKIMFGQAETYWEGALVGYQDGTI